MRNRSPARSTAAPAHSAGSRVPRVRTASLLARAGRVLAGSLDVGETVGAVPHLADACLVEVLGDDGHPRHFEVAAADPLTGDALRALADAPPFADAVARVMATGQPQPLPLPHAPGAEAQAAPDPAPVLRYTLVVPLAGRGAVVGALALASARRPTAAEAAAAEELGAMAGLALHNATLYARAQRATRMRDEVLGVVAHDLRNPLMAISMYAHVVRDAGLPAEQDGWMQVLLRNVERMNALIQDLLDVSALDAGRLRVRPEPCSAAPLLAEALQLLERPAHEAGVRLARRMAADVPPVLADRERVLQVLSNLVGNAVKFSPAGASVEVSVAEREGEVVFSVRDQGQGIAPEDLPRVFDRFWQGAGTRRGGAGLGLAIARGIVESHGGRIWVQSTPGAGSTFFFTLPASPAPPPAPAPAAEGPPEAVAEGGATVRVLLVDDHSFIRRGLRELLRHAPGVAVAGEAENADQAVQRAKALRPDVVLMDLNLPGGGLEATRRIVAAHPSTRVLILTAEPDDRCVCAALEAGAAGYLRKSADPAALPAALHAVHRGERVLDAGLQGWAAAPAECPPGALSEQAVRVLTLAARGYGGAEIAARAGMRPRDAARLRTRSMRALGLSTRAELVRHALCEGWLRPDAPPPRAGDEE
jgi:signal transduction histidine kinase/DNA-binding NarL/FixJ family response regulator